MKEKWRVAIAFVASQVTLENSRLCYDVALAIKVNGGIILPEMMTVGQGSFLCRYCGPCLKTCMVEGF